jgi:hypothetical protein
MKELLLKVFPLVGFYFNENGISATVANAEKNENTNTNANLMRDLQAFELYNTVVTIMGEKGVNTHEVNVRKLTPADFNKLQTVAKNNGKNAILGNGIKIFNKAMDYLKTVDAQKLVELNGEDTTLPKHIDYPIRKQAVSNGTVDSVVNLDRVEDILDRCTAAVLEKLDADMIKKALRLESEASTLGIELTRSQCFLQKVLSAQTALQPVETISNFAVVVKQPILAYTEGELAAFKTLFDNLQKQYQNTQGQLNGIKRTIKDTIRLVEVAFAKEFDAEYRSYNTHQQEITKRLTEIATKGEILRQQLIKELLTLKIQTT